MCACAREQRSINVAGAKGARRKLTERTAQAQSSQWHDHSDPCKTQPGRGVRACVRVCPCACVSVHVCVRARVCGGVATCRQTSCVARCRGLFANLRLHYHHMPAAKSKRCEHRHAWTGLCTMEAAMPAKKHKAQLLRQLCTRLTSTALRYRSASMSCRACRAGSTMSSSDSLKGRVCVCLRT